MRRNFVQPGQGQSSFEQKCCDDCLFSIFPKINFGSKPSIKKSVYDFIIRQNILPVSNGLIFQIKLLSLDKSSKIVFFQV